MKFIKHHFIYIVLILGLVLLVIHFFLKLKESNQNHNKQVTNLIERDSEIAYLKMRLVENDTLAYIVLANEGKLLNESYIIEDIDKKQFYFQNVIKTKKLIFIFSKYNFCQPCVEIQLDLLNDLVSEIGEENILVIGNQFTNKGLRIFNKTHSLNFKLYRFFNEEIILEKNNKNLPFYFVTDTSLELKQLFIPTKEKVLLTKSYLFFAKQLLLNKKS